MAELFQLASDTVSAETSSLASPPWLRLTACLLMSPFIFLSRNPFAFTL